MVQRTCSIEGCVRPHRARGWCTGHYQRWAKAGSAEARMPLGRAPLPRGTELTLEFLVERTSKSDTGCFLWAGYVDRGGYGQIRHDGKTDGAHRVAWEVANGPIPEGMSVDHICHNRACVNADHLRLASPTENQWNRSGAERASSSGIRNVRWEARRKRWLVRVIKNGRAHGGYYKELEEAALAAETLRRELFGQFSGPTPRLDALSSRSPEGA